MALARTVGSSSMASNVARIGERTRSDDAEGVAEIALLGGFAEMGLEWLCCGSAHRAPSPPRVSAGILPVRTAKASGARSRTAGPVCKGFAGQPPAFFERADGTRLALTASRAERGRLMVIQVLLVAYGPD